MADLLPYDDRDGVIWYNGSLMPWRDAKMHVLSHGLHYASCVFEGERAYDGRIFKAEEHTERLLESARALDFEIPYACETLVNASREVVAALGIGDGYVRPVAWRGAEMMGARGCGRMRKPANSSTKSPGRTGPSPNACPSSAASR